MTPFRCPHIYEDVPGESQKRCACGTRAFPKRSVADRFWEKVDLTGGMTSCWEWTGTRTKGYGRLRAGRVTAAAHNVGYELMVGQVPLGLELDHLCRNPGCVNPMHLEPVTRRENSLRGISPMAKNAAKTHCIHGHPFDEANTHHRRDGRRQCRTCDRAKHRRPVTA